jgi:hypothetical protein
VIQHEDSNENGRNWMRQNREGRIGNGAAFSMNFVQAKNVASGVPINGTCLTRLKLTRQSVAAAMLDLRQLCLSRQAKLAGINRSPIQSPD